MASESSLSLSPLVQLPPIYPVLHNSVRLVSQKVELSRSYESGYVATTKIRLWRVSSPAENFGCLDI